jgi:hypothetical protein
MHIGPMKSGTTAIQRAASTRRKALLRHGVRYPGSGLNHYTEVCALMGLRREGERPAIETWESLLEEVEADTSRRIFINHEWICEADDPMAQRFVDALGDETHVAITLRPLSGMATSYWQEIVKNGATTRPFDQWLRRALARPPGEQVRSRWERQCDHAGIVERWERLLGPDRVTVVIADKANPSQVPATLARLLDLPAGMLDDTGADGGHANRSLSAPEAEFFRRQNVVFKENNVPFADYALAYRRGAVARILRSEFPEAERKILLPTWAADLATEYGKGIADRLATSKVQIVGDLAALHAPVSPTIDGDYPVFDTIPMDIAVEAVAGTVSAGAGRGPFFEPRKKARQPDVTAHLSDRILRLPFGRTILRVGRSWREWRGRQAAE